MYSSGVPTHNTKREHTFLHIAENANVQILHIMKKCKCAIFAYFILTLMCKYVILTA